MEADSACLVTKQKFNYGQGGKQPQLQTQEENDLSAGKSIEITVRSGKYSLFREDDNQDKKSRNKMNVWHVLAIYLTKFSSSFVAI